MNTFGITLVIIATIIFVIYLNRKNIEAKNKGSKVEKLDLLKSIGSFLIAIVIINFLIGATGSNSAGTGKINIFPNNASIKNYRLDAWLIRKDNYLPLFTSNTYEVSNVYWGEDGQQDISVEGCFLKESESKPCVIGQDEYVVEIAEIGCISNGPDECE